nr:hypothetical protein [Stenotrophomonas maltophilia]
MHARRRCPAQGWAIRSRVFLPGAVRDRHASLEVGQLADEIVGAGTQRVVAVLGVVEVAGDHDVRCVVLRFDQAGGLQATRLIKSQDDAPYIVIPRHFDDPEHRDHALRAGADNFVSQLPYLQGGMPIPDGPREEHS